MANLALGNHTQAVASPADEESKFERDCVTIQDQHMEVKVALALSLNPLLAIFTNVQVRTSFLILFSHREKLWPFQQDILSRVLAMKNMILKLSTTFDRLSLLCQQYVL